MNTEFFPQFIRANYSVLKNESNELLIELGEEFKKYLTEKFTDNKEKLEAIWNINPKSVIMNQINDPFSIKGYHPALLIHFNNFIEKMRNEI